jgi:hypothetical protein
MSFALLSVIACDETTQGMLVYVISQKLNSAIAEQTKETLLMAEVETVEESRSLDDAVHWGQRAGRVVSQVRRL